MKKWLPAIAVTLSACGGENPGTSIATPTADFPGYENTTLVRTLASLPQGEDGQQPLLYAFDGVSVLNGGGSSGAWRPVTAGSAFSFAAADDDAARFTLHFNEDDGGGLTTTLRSGDAQTPARQALSVLENLAAMIESDSPFEAWDATLLSLTPPSGADTGTAGALAEFSLMDYARYGAWSVQRALSPVAERQAGDESGDNVYIGFYHYGLLADARGIPRAGNADYKGHGFGMASDGRFVAGDAFLDVDFAALTAQLTLLALNVSQTPNPSAETPPVESPWYDSIAFAPAAIFESGYAGGGAVSLSDNTVGGLTVLPLDAGGAGRVEGSFYGPVVLRGGNPEESAGTWQLSAGGIILRGAFGVELVPPPIGQSVDSATLADAYSHAPHTALLGFDTLLMLHERRTTPTRVFTAIEGEGWFSLQGEDSLRIDAASPLFVFSVHDFTNDVALQFAESDEALPGNELSSQSAAELYLVRMRALALAAGVAEDGVAARRLFADNAPSDAPAAGGALRANLAYATYGVWGVDPRRLGADAQTGNDIGGVEEIQLGFYHSGLLTPADELPRAGNAAYEGFTVGGGAGVVISGEALVSVDFTAASVVLRLSELRLESVSGFEDETENWYDAITFPTARLAGALYETASPGGVNPGTAPADSSLTLQGTVTGSFRGALYGARPTGEPAESAGVWALEDATRKLRGAFGGVFTP